MDKKRATDAAIIGRPPRRIKSTVCKRDYDLSGLADVQEFPISIERSKQFIMEKTGLPKYDIHRIYYWDDAELVGSHRLPQLAPQTFIPHDVVSFNERNTVKNPAKHWLDFFIDDNQFECCWTAFERSLVVDCASERATWRLLDRYISLFKRFEGIIGTDYSMFPEMLPDQRNWNCARNRVFAYRLQRHGIPCIPVASWCCAEDWEWCFDGLPAESSIAVSTNGCCRSAETRRMFRRGVDELIRQKSPYAVIVCGRRLSELEGCKANLVFYPSFSQRMKERIYGR